MSAQWIGDIESCPRCKTPADGTFGSFTICRSCGAQWKPATHEVTAPTKSDRRRAA